MIKYNNNIKFKIRKIVYSLLLIILIFFNSCRSNHAQKHIKRDSLIISDSLHFDDSLIDTIQLGLNFNPDITYSDAKKKALDKRSKFQASLSSTHDSTMIKSIIDSAGYFFTNHLLNEIVPHWYGTFWDFDGYTEKPNAGVIACGYFVSTTLKHMGLNINRYKFAQQWGINEAKTLQPNHKLLIYSLNEPSETDSILTVFEKTLKEGLYFVGLSNHVGYIYVKDEILYFLHSNYIDGYVMIEKARYSNAFRSMIYVIADISDNDELIKNWITNSYIPVVEK